MSTASESEEADREAVFKALAEGKKVDPEVAKRVRRRSEEVRRKFDYELSVELIRSCRDE